MENRIQSRLTHYKKAHERNRRRRIVLSALSLFVVVATALCLMLPAVTMETICGMEAHVHDAECYSSVEKHGTRTIICGTESLGSVVIHFHDIKCYDADGSLICALPEISHHVHSDACYNDVQNVICGQEESAGHIHEDACYGEQLTCGQDERSPHYHGEDCVEGPLTPICGLAEDLQHTHVESCFENPWLIICGQAEDVGHTHTESCYSLSGDPICGLAAGEGGHSHEEACYQTEHFLFCGEEELLLHTHTNECADGSCGLPEVIVHQHTDTCIHETEAYIEQILTCTLFEHEHTPECYPDEGVICGTKAHMHIESCFDENGNLICGKREHEHTAECIEADDPENEGTDAAEFVCGFEAHIHDESCFDENGNLNCGKQEHEHTAECIEADGPENEGTDAAEFVCGLEAHIHDESCFDENGNLACGKQEHGHTEVCAESREEIESEIIPGENENYIPDPYSRVESAEYVVDALSRIVLTGNWAEDVLAVAKSQLGYRESATDYIISEEGRKKGYTYYGDRYGIPYGDWCAMFVSFCLDTAGVKNYPLSAGCQSWIEKLSAGDINMWHPAVDPATGKRYVPKIGDLIFYDFERNGCAEHVGIVLELIEGTENEPALIKTIEGNYSDKVCIVTHAQMYEGIMGYGELPGSPWNSDVDTDDIVISAVTQSGIGVTINGPMDSFPFAENELILSAYEIDADEDIVSENSIYGKLADDLNLSAEELWSKGIRILGISLQHDGNEVHLTGSVTLTVKGIPASILIVYTASDKAQTWSSVDSAVVEVDGNLQFETDRLGLIGIETTGRARLLRAPALRSRETEQETLTVYKVWADGVGAHAADEIEVGLLFDDGVNGPVMEDCQILSAATNWTHTFTLQHTMENNGRLQYSVIENVEGYQTRYGAITKMPEADAVGWWVPADSLEDGEIYVFVSEYNNRTYTPAGHYDMDTSAPSYMSAIPVDVVSSPITVNGIQYSEYLQNVNDAASFTVVAQSGGGYIIRNQWTQRYMDVRGYCPMNITTYSTLNYVNSRVKSTAGSRWLKIYQVTGGFDYTQATSENDATVFRLFKLIPGESANAYQTTITNKRINPHQGGIEGTDSPEIYKTIDWLGDDGNNPDTVLRGEEYYRLYLDVRALTNSQPVDLLLVLDNSGSMFDGSLRVDGKLRNDVLLEILYTLIPEFLSANSGNRISHVYFSGPPSGYYTFPASVPTNITSGNVADDAWLSQEWTQNAANAVNSLEIRCKFVVQASGAGTNYSAGLVAAREQIEKSLNAGRTPYVLFLSDGVPTYYIQSNGLRGGNGNDLVGMSIMHDFYNVAKKNVEACRQPTLNAIAAFKAAYPNITMSAIGFSALAQETHVSIMTQMPHNGGFFQHATDVASLREALTAAFAAAATSNVTVTDELSPYVQIPTAANTAADYKVVMTEVATNAATVLYQDGTTTQAGQGIIQSVGYTGGNGIDSTGTIQLRFADDYVLDSKYRYTISYNVEVTPKAYDEFASNGYGNVIGDDETDYPGNATSSGQPGFHSNKIAYVEYLLGGAPHTDYYAYPVVQVTEPAQKTVDLTISKSVIDGDLNEDFEFEVIFMESNGDPFVDIPSGSGYTVDSSMGKVAFTLKSGQSVTISGLPENITAMIHELSHDGYTVLIKEGNQTLYAADSGSILLTDDREITVVNNAGTVLPETGGAGTLIFTFSGIAIMLSALMFGCKWRKRERRQLVSKTS